ncbi:hypothetical protein GCM10019016_038080 [Streptomyces prasinosporus]|uniref:Uncharacterized protein n=1 Tax=Streptomyces prasinosporus TaxID=68256 RepID=A0ABP6TQF9_9ACTN
MRGAATISWCRYYAPEIERERLSAMRMVIKPVAAILDALAVVRGLTGEIPLVLVPSRSVTGSAYAMVPGATALRRLLPGPWS